MRPIRALALCLFSASWGGAVIALVDHGVALPRPAQSAGASPSAAQMSAPAPAPERQDIAAIPQAPEPQPAIDWTAQPPVTRLPVREDHSVKHGQNRHYAIHDLPSAIDALDDILLDLSRRDLTRFEPASGGVRPGRKPDQTLERVSHALFAFLPGPRSRPKRQPAPVVLPSSDGPGKSPAFTLNQAAYTALSGGQTRRAETLFQQSLAVDAGQPQVLAQLGYLAKARGDFPAAQSAFEAASAAGGRVQPGLARELSDMRRPLRLSAYTVWREGSRSVSDPAFGPSLAQSQSGLGARYRLPVKGWASRQGLSVYSRLFWAYEAESLSIDGSTTQAGIGMQVRPIPGLNLITAAERLISVGSQGRDDWLVRASWSGGQGFAPLDGQDRWLHWSSYLDAALIDPADPDVQLIGDARLGMGLRPFGASSLSLIPFAGLSASYEDAAGRSTDLYEASAGLWMRFWPGGVTIPDAQRVLDLRLEYRGKMAGDSPSSSGVRLTLGVNY